MRSVALVVGLIIITACVQIEPIPENPNYDLGVEVARENPSTCDIYEQTVEDRGYESAHNELQVLWLQAYAESGEEGIAPPADARAFADGYLDECGLVAE